MPAWTVKGLRKLLNNPPPSQKRIFERGDQVGLHVQQTPSGTITPSLQYSSPVTGRRTFYRLGERVTPKTSDQALGKWLRQVRDSAATALDQLALGTDPKLEQQASACGTVNDVLDLYLKVALEGRYTHDQMVKEFERDVRPVIGRMQANLVTKKDIAQVFRRIYTRAQKRGKTGEGSVRKLRGALGKAFDLAIKYEGSARMQVNCPGLSFAAMEYNPVRATEEIKAPAPRDRKLTEAELRAVWRATYSYTDMRLGAAIRLALLTTYRRGTVAGLTWAEVGVDDIFVPATAIGRNKSQRDHHLPITPLLRQVIDECRLFGHPIYLLPRADGAGPLPTSTVSTEFKHFVKHSGVAPFTFHDLRRTAIHMMRRIGIDGDTRRLIANHAMEREDTHERHYAQPDWGDLRPAVLRGLTQWHDALQGIVGGGGDDNVVPLRGVG